MKRADFETVQRAMIDKLRKNLRNSSKELIKSLIVWPFKRERIIRNNFPSRVIHLNKEILEFRRHDLYYEPHMLPYISTSKSEDLSVRSELQQLEINDPDYPTIYSASDDMPPPSLYEYKNEYPQILIAVGNLRALDILANLDPSQLFFIDPNKDQLLYLDLIIKLIKDSENRVEFVSRLLGKRPSAVDTLFEEYETLTNNVVDLEHGQEQAFEDQFWRLSEEKVPINEIHKSFLEYDYITQNGYRIGIDIKNFGKDTWLVNSYPCLLNDQAVLPPSMGVTNPMSLIKPHGFLSSESSYDFVSERLNKIPYILLPGGIDANLIHYIASNNPYIEIHIWLSNFFTDAMPLIDRIEYLDKFEGKINITPWYDIRKNATIDCIDPSVHWKAFAKVNKYLKQPVLEVVNVEDWIGEESNLPNTKICSPEEMQVHAEDFETVFFHILVGHGMSLDEYVDIVNSSFNLFDQVVLLEHNKEGDDFDGYTGTTPKQLEKGLGRAAKIEYTEGYTSDDRNFVMYYEINNS